MFTTSYIDIVTKLPLNFYNIPNNFTIKLMVLRQSNYSSRLGKVVREPSSSRSAYSFLSTIHEESEEQTFD